MLPNPLKIFDSLQPEPAGAVGVGNSVTGAQFPGVVKPQGIVAGTAEDKAQTGAGQGAAVGIARPGGFIERHMPAINEGS